jgi:hypothetical protein
MKEAMLLNKEHTQEFMTLIYGFFKERRDWGISVECFNECPTDSEHIHRLSIFIRDKEHDPKDLRWADEIKRYFEDHFRLNRRVRNHTHGGVKGRLLK